MAKLYVVLGEQGEYSDRDVWVSGVFTHRADAEAAVAHVSKLEEARKEYTLRKNKLLAKLVPPLGMNISQRVEALAFVKEVLGPEPPIERGEDWDVVEVDLNVWNTEGYPAD